MDAPSAKRYFNSKNSRYLMEEIMVLKTVFSIFFSLRTVQLYSQKAVLKTVFSKPAPKVFSLRRKFLTFMKFINSMVTIYFVEHKYKL